MTNIINKNLQPAREARAERIGNWIAAVVMLTVAAVVFTMAVIAFVAPQWLIGGV